MKALLPLTLLLLAAGPDVQVAYGQWTSTVEIIDVRMPNAPPGMAAAMKGRPMTTSYCVSPEQARQGMRGALRPDSGCRFDEIVARAGILRTRMTCTRPTGTMTVVASGSYTPNSFAMTSTMTGTGRMPITMTSRGSGRRTGPCRS